MKTISPSGERDSKFQSDDENIRYHYASLKDSYLYYHNHVINYLKSIPHN